MTLSEISASSDGVTSSVSSCLALSCAMQSSTWASRAFTFSISLARLRSTVLRQTNVYLFAFDSIFVPSTYSTSRLTNPLSARTSTSCVNMLLISSFRRLRKRLIVMKSGFSYPASQMKCMSRRSNCSMRPT